MLRTLAFALLIPAFALADDNGWAGKSVSLKSDLKLGRKFGGGLVRDGDPLDKSKPYSVKSDDGTYLELTGQTGFIFKIDADVIAEPAKPDPVVGTYNWYTGAEFVIRADGTASAKLDDKTWDVKWLANPYGGYVFIYKAGGVDVVTLSNDGKKLEGTGYDKGKSYPVSGTRK